jgi:hypothetical protein
MMVPVAPGILARFGTGSHLTVVGYQNETNKKAIGAVRILDRISAVNEHCNRLSTHLIAHPKWNILRVETEMLGYRLRDGDHEPFPIDGFSLDDDEDDEE